MHDGGKKKCSDILGRAPQTIQMLGGGGPSNHIRKRRNKTGHYGEKRISKACPISVPREGEPITKKPKKAGWLGAHGRKKRNSVGPKEFGGSRDSEGLRSGETGLVKNPV